MRFWRDLLKGFVIQVSCTLIQLLARSLHLLLGVNQTCRFNPSCRNYASQAVEQWGVWKGIGLTLRRLSRCHPWGASGWDPVPKKGTSRI